MDVEYALTRMFVRELEMHRNLEQFKESELLQKLEIDLGEIYFELLSVNSYQEYISDKNLKSFCKRCKVSFIDDDITALLRRMNR